jgi:O-antigen/teichoic acid export membrane protein
MIPFFYINNVIGNILIATFNEKYQLMSIIIGTISKLSILGLFTQKFGLLGVVMALLVGELVCLIIQIYGAKNYLKISFKNQKPEIILILAIFGIQILTKGILLSSILLLISILIISFFSYKEYRKLV